MKRSMLFQGVAVLGRTNAGKSTLVNALAAGASLAQHAAPKAAPKAAEPSPHLHGRQL